MTTTDLIQTICFRYQLMRKMQEIGNADTSKSRRSTQRAQLILSLKNQIWMLKRKYREMKTHSRGMLYEYNGRFFLATKEITLAEYYEAKRLQSLKVA